MKSSACCRPRSPSAAPAAALRRGRALLLTLREVGLELLDVVLAQAARAVVRLALQQPLLGHQPGAAGAHAAQVGGCVRGRCRCGATAGCGPRATHSCVEVQKLAAIDLTVALPPPPLLSAARRLRLHATALQAGRQGCWAKLRGCSDQTGRHLNGWTPA